MCTSWKSHMYEGLRGAAGVLQSSRLQQVPDHCPTYRGDHMWGHLLQATEIIWRQSPLLAPLQSRTAARLVVEQLPSQQLDSHRLTS